MPNPGGYALVVNPTFVGPDINVKFTRILIDNGRSINIMYRDTMHKLDITENMLEPSRTTFHGIVSGLSCAPMGKVWVDIMVGTRENCQTESILFEIVDLTSPYHALLGRSALAKFMAAKHVSYLKMKIPGPNGVITISGNYKRSLVCASASSALGKITGDCRGEEMNPQRCSLGTVGSARDAWFQMKLNKAKCTFGVSASKLLGFLVSSRGIKVNPIKINAIEKMVLPKCLNDVQKFTGCLASLSHFVSRLGEKALPLYQLMKKTDKFIWTPQADAAFHELKKMLASAPILASPLSKEMILLYIAATNRVVSAVVVVEREEEGKPVQRPVYYLSEVLLASKQNYPHYQKMTYGVYMAAKKLKNYFEEHEMRVVCAAPISEIIGNKDVSGRIAKCAIELAPYTPQYERRDAMKSQALAEFLVDWTEIHFVASNNVAEYESLVHGLKVAKEIGIRRIQCYGDSDLVVKQIMASPSINFNQFLEKEKLKSNGSNFTDWFRHVRIFLNGGNLQFVLEAPLGPPPPPAVSEDEKNVYETRVTRYSQVQCAILCSLEAELQKRFEHHDPYELVHELKTIFETHAAVESYEASKHFFGCMMEEGSSVSEHVLAMSGHAKKLSDLGIVIPNKLGIHRVLQSLPPSYKNFVMNYNMRMNKELPELFSMLKSAEVEIQKEHQVLMVNKTTSFKKQGKPKKGNFKKGSKKVAAPPEKPKAGPKPDTECYYARRRGTWKRNCPKYMADLKSGLVKKRKIDEERTTPDLYDPSLNVMIVDNNDEDPVTYEEAMMSPDSNKWHESMKSEMGSMYDNQVWTLVDLPDSRKAVENKWIFKRKTDADGNITVYKA
ncbi:hypothetical protein QYE76_048505 [Lolium multiflorum]|uniref:Uncharacterized protein n=1 Tax=Lolium multiflorum TaxID=4521 RepID=A0AAD8SL05_LOLMU|nr:hypothetical protein QYE76_048505 [Lolium multiflorum]